MIDDNDTLNHITNASFKNLNQILRTFDNPIDGAYTYNDSRYITMKSDTQNSPCRGENGPIVSSNDCRYVVIDNVDTIAPQNVCDTFSVFSLNIQSINAKFVSLMVYWNLLA